MGHFRIASDLFLVVYVLVDVPFAPHVGHRSQQFSVGSCS